MPKPSKDTSWNKVAKWYDKHLGQQGGDSYHSQVVIPGVIKLLKQHVPAGSQLLDLACGQGIFSREAVKLNYKVIGVDLAAGLIAAARKRSPGIIFHVADAHKLEQIPNNSIDAVICILALQNMDKLEIVFREVSRVLKPAGKFIFVINHPYFRIPRQTAWGDDDARKIQYRRIDRYKSPLKIPITAHPGQAKSEITWSFHLPLESYIKFLAQNKMSLIDLEEWTSHKVSEPGPKAKAENTARQEFPLFMAVVAES